MRGASDADRKQCLARREQLVALAGHVGHHQTHCCAQVRPGKIGRCHHCLCVFVFGGAAVPAFVSVACHRSISFAGQAGFESSRCVQGSPRLRLGVRERREARSEAGQPRDKNLVVFVFAQFREWIPSGIREFTALF
jgi:hypothetical protein